MAPSTDRVLFVTSNGTGLGHLTRSMATARRLDPGIEPAFFTLSAAAPVVREMGFPVDYMPSYDAPGAPPVRTWDRRLRRRLEALIDELSPRVLCFDGAHPYPAVVRTVMRHLDMIGLWSRRPLWKPGRGGQILAWSGAFDVITEPGELAGSEDRGLTVKRRKEAVAIDPVVFSEHDELLSRADAETALGLEPGRTNALIALGQGNEVAGAVRRSIERLAGEPGLQVAALESSLSADLGVPSQVVRLRDTYPVSRYYRAFDLVISAAGYNSFHELIRFAVPTLFVAMPRELDDQAARARWAHRNGVALGCERPSAEDLDELLEEILDPARRAQIAHRAGELRLSNGAEKAARLVSRLARTGIDPELRKELPTPAVEKRRFLLTLALARTSALVRYPMERAVRRGPSVAYDARGVTEVQLTRGLDEVIREAGGERERVLVVTDSPRFGPLLRARVPFEYVPPPGELAAQPQSEDPDSAVEWRLRQAVRGLRLYPWPT